MEVWKSVVGYEGAYEISNLGGIRSLDRHIWRADSRRKGGGCYHSFKGKRLSPKIMKNSTCKYKVVTLSYCDGPKASRKRSVKMVHRLVWEAFNGPIPAKHDIDHKDNNAGNNRLDNLDCLSKKEHQARHFKERYGIEGWTEALKQNTVKQWLDKVECSYHEGYAQALKDVQAMEDTKTIPPTMEALLDRLSQV